MGSYREITVGPRQADILGKDNRAIQMALDAMAYRGGGTVRVLPGQYTCYGPVRLRSNVRLVGDRAKTVLRMGPVVRSRLALDADIGQKEITPVDASGFCAGMGVTIGDRNGRSPMATMPLTIARVSDGVLHLTDYNVHDMNAERGDCVVSYFPLIHACEVDNATVDGFTLDAAPDSMDGLKAHWGGAIYMRYARHCLIRNVTARGCVGDGIRFGRSEHVTVEDCETADNYHYGIHPGSHSPWTTVRRCHIHHNGSDGLYLCWGVREGMFEDNAIHHNGGRLHRNGISIGHKDVDNVIARNHVYENAKHGLCFRVKTEGNWAHRNLIRENVIENNGSPKNKVPPALRKEPRYEVLCCGVFIRGVTHDLTFERNIIRETRRGKAAVQHNAFYLDKGVSRVRLMGNTVSDHPGGKLADDSHSRDNDLHELS